MKILRRRNGWANARERCRAFTLLEMLVLIGVITLLALIEFTAVAKASGQTKRVRCAGNLRQFAAAMHMFAHDDGNLPNNQNIGFWAWDVRASVGTFVESTGARWSVMYCPGTSPPFTERDNFELYNYGAYRILGYVTSFTNTATLAATNQNSSLTPPRLQVTGSVFKTEQPAKRVMLADVTMSAPGQNNPAMAHTYNFTSVAGGFRLPHRTAHLNNGIARPIPAGGNLAMLDGHVEWRRFQNMVPRTLGGSPVFWW
jgi:prepilin-type processing-associated H-X9-DG protein